MTASHRLFSPLYQAYLNARKKKKPSVNQLAFEGQLLDNLCLLSHALHTHRWHPKPYLSFVALKPKARQIHAPDFSDRVVHHWLVPQLEAVFEPKFIYDSYANRIGKGTHQAVQRLQQFVKKTYSGITGKTNHQLADHGKGYYLQCDIANFFNSIHRPTLHALLTKHIQQLPSTVRYAVHQLLAYPVSHTGVRCKATYQQLHAVPEHKKLENAAVDCGLPIGNLSSQFFANVYMNELDQFVKHSLKAKYYLRYVDDFVLLSESQSQLQTWLVQIQTFLAQRLQLSLKPSPICKPIITGIDFLGFVVFPHHTQVRRRVVANLRYKIHQQQTKQQQPRRPYSVAAAPIITKSAYCHYFAQPCMRYYLWADVPGYQQLRSVYASYLGHIQHANHHKLLAKLHQDYPYLQQFHLHTKFATVGWFEPRLLWLWTELIPATMTPETFITHDTIPSKQQQPRQLECQQQEQPYAVFNNPTNSSSNNAITNAIDNPINNETLKAYQAVQLCFDFGSVGCGDKPS